MKSVEKDLFGYTKKTRRPRLEAAVIKRREKRNARHHSAIATGRTAHRQEIRPGAATQLRRRETGGEDFESGVSESVLCGENSLRAHTVLCFQ